MLLKPVAGRPGLPPIKYMGCSNNNTAANSGLWIWGFKEMGSRPAKHLGWSAHAHANYAMHPCNFRGLLIVLSEYIVHDYFISLSLHSTRRASSESALQVRHSGH